MSRDNEFAFSSYFSIRTTTDTTGSHYEFNPFDSNSYSSYGYTTSGSSDILYDASTGKVNFYAPGVYLAVLSFTTTLSNTALIIGRMKLNGSDVSASPKLAQVHAAATNAEFTLHTLIEVNECDYLEATIQIDPDSADSYRATSQNGTHLTLLRSNGDFGNILYTADANAAGSSGSEFIIGDADNGGTISTSLNKNRSAFDSVGYVSNTGKFTTDNTKKFLMLSTLIPTVTVTGDITGSLYANNSKILDLATSAVQTSPTQDPYEMSVGLLKTLAAGQTCSARAKHASSSIIVSKGSAFTIFDISYSGVDPDAYLSISTAALSNALSSGDKICFDSGEYSSFSKTDHVTATNINYTADGGTFEIVNEGKYFILWNITIGHATSNAVRTVKVLNGSTEVYNGPWVVHSAEDPQEKTVCLIVHANAEDSFTFVIEDVAGRINNGTTITMFKVNNLREVTNIFEDGQPCGRQAPIDLIGEDFTFNNYAIDSLGRQHTIVDTKQPPFIIGTPGPLSLRGRTFASDEQVGVVSDGGKKN